MGTFEKIYALLAIGCAVAIFWLLWAYPHYRQLHTLVPISLTGLLVNVGLMFIVFRDITLRQFARPTSKIAWIALLLIFWPAILIYLPLHGFRPRTRQTS